MSFTIDQLNEVDKLDKTDILHARNVAGFDHKIKVENAGVSLAPHSQHLRTAEYTKITADESWTTILRTRKNVSLYLQITVHHHPGRLHRSVENEWLTLGINGAQIQSEWGVNILDYDTTQKPNIVRKNISNIVTTKKQGGIYRIRWGSAGDGLGMCLQMQINYNKGRTLRGFSTKVRASAFGAQRTDIGVSNSFSFFDAGTYPIDLFKDIDGNDVLSSAKTTNNSVYTYYYSAFSELIKAGQLRSMATDYTVYYRGVDEEGYPYDDQGLHDNYLYPGIYNNVNIIFDNAQHKTSINNYRFPMLSGKYVILGNFEVEVKSSYKASTNPPKLRVINPNWARGYSSGDSHWLGGGFATVQARSGATDRDWFGANAATATTPKRGGSTFPSGEKIISNEPWGYPGGFSGGRLPFANGKFGGASGRMGGRGFDTTHNIGYARGAAAPCGGGITSDPHKGSGFYFRGSPWSRAGWAIMNVVGKCNLADCVVDASAEELARGAPDTSRGYGVPKFVGVPTWQSKVHGMTVGGGGGGFFGIRILEGSQVGDFAFPHDNDYSNKNKISKVNVNGGSALSSGDPLDIGGGGGGGIVEVYCYNDISGMSNTSSSGTGGRFVDPDWGAQSGYTELFDLADIPGNQSFYSPTNPAQSWNRNQWAGAIINLEGGWWY